ncbi:hypothetical protein FGE12_10040 [Aggregicoccus sp. 17bor-14]|uniref:SBBP repeat-containing protein n=1 Tax=Myxococcaceae TaxID=31 RepID=UPI00129CBCDE|nr:MULTISPECIES: SBBP repeat-containing protein [Myxococcaceae]MBF5042740.1 hypothetical protein [Simulacricoccus sp. 17bor-14]MRI88508.1 hypothetical protein [Aggregicoccus sp. 17bor-14]
MAAHDGALRGVAAGLALALLGCAGGEAEPVCARVTWSELQLGTAEDDVGVALGVDAACHVYVAGTTRGRFEGAPEGAQGAEDAFLLRLGTDGRPAWVRQLGSPEADTLADLAVDAAGDAVLVGTAQGALPGRSASPEGDLYAARYGADGSLRWTRQQGGPGTDLGMGVALGDDGQVCLSGGSVAGTGSLGAPAPEPRGGTEATLDCLDAQGQLLWRSVYGTEADDWGHPLARGPDGALYVAGATMGGMEGEGAGSTDVFLTRFGPDHARTWTRQLRTPDIDGPLAVALDGHGGLYLLAVSFSDLLTGALENDGVQNAFLFRFREDGTLEWARRLGRAEDAARASGLALDAAGGVYVAGTTRGALEGAPRGGSDAFLAKLDARGDTVWVRQWGSPADDEARDVVVTRAGDVLVVGSTRSAAGERDVVLRRFDTDGR